MLTKTINSNRSRARWLLRSQASQQLPRLLFPPPPRWRDVQVSLGQRGGGGQPRTYTPARAPTPLFRFPFGEQPFQSCLPNFQFSAFQRFNFLNLSLNSVSSC